MAARGRECKHIFPYDITFAYTLVRECVAGTYVSTVMKTRPLQLAGVIIDVPATRCCSPTRMPE